MSSLKCGCQSWKIHTLWSGEQIKQIREPKNQTQAQISIQETSGISSPGQKCVQQRKGRPQVPCITG